MNEKLLCRILDEMLADFKVAPECYEYRNYDKMMDGFFFTHEVHHTISKRPMILSNGYAIEDKSNHSGTIVIVFRSNIFNAGNTDFYISKYNSPMESVMQVCNPITIKYKWGLRWFYRSFWKHLSLCNKIGRYTNQCIDRVNQANQANKNIEDTEFLQLLEKILPNIYDRDLLG